MIAWQVFINIGMVMGLLPVVGVTLPFCQLRGVIRYYHDGGRRAFAQREYASVHV